eukprot:266615_1
MIPLPLFLIHWVVCLVAPQWIRPTTTLWNSVVNNKFAVGYHHPYIVLLGGNDGLLQQIDTIADNDIIINNGSAVGPIRCNGDAQFYAQISNDLFILAWTGDVLDVYYLDTYTYESNWITLNTNAKFGCIASTSDYIFIIGGTDGFPDNNFFGDVQIVNVHTKQWITGPFYKLRTKRAGQGCVVHPFTNKLYVLMGGYIDMNGFPALDSIEYLDIGDMGNLQSQPWYYNPYSMVYPANMARSVVYSDMILIVGGWYCYASGYPNCTYVDRVQTFNVYTSQVSIDHYLSAAWDPSSYIYGMNKVTPIVIRSRLYMLGGQTDEWQYLDIPTSEPTTDPTSNPTQPTRGPTGAPSRTPSAAPSSAPTLSP